MSMGLRIVPQKERKLGRWIVAFFITILILVAAWSFYAWYTKGTPLPIPIPIAKADPSVEEVDIAASAVDSHTVDASEPRYISIPSLDISIKARVFNVGVNSQNMVAMPKNIHDAGWYGKSMTPGSGYGAVLITGHSQGIHKEGVFAELSRLKTGDTVSVERGDGQTFTYIVKENTTASVEEASKDGMKTMMESAEPGKEGLNLMTTAGNWVPRLQVFDQRVMVRATLRE